MWRASIYGLEGWVLGYSLWAIVFIPHKSDMHDSLCLLCA